MLLVLLVEKRGILLAVCRCRSDSIGMCAVRYTCARPSHPFLTYTFYSHACGRDYRSGGAINHSPDMWISVDVMKFDYKSVNLV
jgi:hypothetical protein